MLVESIGELTRSQESRLIQRTGCILTKTKTLIIIIRIIRITKSR